MTKCVRLALIFGLMIALAALAFPANLLAQDAGRFSYDWTVSAGSPDSSVPGVIEWNGSLPATGLKEPTAAEKDWVKKNLPVIQNISLNQLALERINAERSGRGLKSFSADKLDLASVGNEALFASAPNGNTYTASALTGILPNSVDNSALPAFPPIRSQGSIGSCAAWATTYYQFTYETNLARGTTASSGDNNNIFSPKWTYNMINGGGDNGSYFSAAYAVEMKNGAATWADFPYNSNYLEWPLVASTWRNALNYRPLSYGQISNSNVELLIGNLKTQLANGHLIVIATYVSSWAQKTVGNDPSTSEDNAFAGQKNSRISDKHQPGRTWHDHRRIQ